MDFLFTHILLLISTGALLFLPGFILLRFLLRKEAPLSSWEMLIASSSISIGLLDFLMILLGKSGTLLTPLSIGISLAMAVYVLSVIRRIILSFRKKPEKGDHPSSHPAFELTKIQGAIFLMILSLTFFTKGLYLSDAAFPTSTDLGHHLYWAKEITEKGLLPDYAKREVIADTEGVEILSEPEPIADFIIGEHLPLAALALFSGSDFLSAFPVNTLFLINILSLLAFFALAIRFGEEIRTKISSFSPQYFGLMTLFLLGPIYTLASPQAKFVSGGVVGNTFGNFFIPVILLFFFRAVKEKNPFFMGITFFLIFTLAYTHHLSTLILLFILVAGILTLLILHRRELKNLLSDWIRILAHPMPMMIAFFCILFFFAVAMPTYIETNAVGTAIGTPTKLTRVGLTFQEVLSGSGEARAAIGFAGLILITFLAKSFRYTAGVLIGWTGILLIMSLWPHLVFLDIPSNRIGSYVLFPLSLLAAFTLLLTAEFFRTGSKKKVMALPMTALLLFIMIIFTAMIGSGSADNGGTLRTEKKATEAVQTFAAAEFLAQRLSPENTVLKDHNYIPADSFMKLFFMKDYGYPLSRGYFKRYETPGHEQCTLTMIAAPNTPAGEKCYASTGTDVVIVNPIFDRAQFEKSPEFSRIYSSPLIHAYKKTRP